MLQLRSRLNVADNSGAKKAWAIGVLGIRKDNASIGDVIKAALQDKTREFATLSRFANWECHEEWQPRQ